MIIYVDDLINGKKVLNFSVRYDEDA